LLNLATETDIERLRQAAMLLEQENARLFRRIETLVAELAEARGEDARSLQLEIECLKQQLASRTKALFGDSSERRACVEHERTGERKEPRPGHGPREQKALPIVEVIHELDEPDQVCPSCGGDLKPMRGQFGEADEIDVVERSFRIVRHKRQKYRCRCGDKIETALGPDKLVPGGRYSIDFAVDVAIAKFADHLPLERQVRQMARDGLDVDSSTLWEQTWFLSKHLTSTYEANHAYVLASDVIAVDETWWRLMKKGASKRWWVWSVAREDAVSYRLLPSRSTDAARQVLGDYAGVAICDGYKAYDVLAREREGSDLTLAHCWAHVRRKFVEAELHYPEAGEVLDRIGQLYAIEAEAKRASPEERLATLAALRAEQSRPILDEIRTWLMTQRALPRSALGKAIAYTSGLWPGLVRFLGEPKIPLDTNGVERALRGVAVGRKNHYGSRSERGTRVAALFYSLIESAKLCGVEPRAYLREATLRAVRNPGAATLARELKSPES
jgi:transposase